MERCGMELKTEKIFYATASARREKSRGNLPAGRQEPGYYFIKEETVLMS